MLLGLVLYRSWRCVSRAGLMKDNTPPEIGKAIVRRIMVGQALYAFGAALCVVDTYASIAFIVLVQLNFAIAPPFSWPAQWRRPWESMAVWVLEPQAPLLRQRLRRV